MQICKYNEQAFICVCVGMRMSCKSESMWVCAMWVYASEYICMCECIHISVQNTLYLFAVFNCIIFTIWVYLFYTSEFIHVSVCIWVYASECIHLIYLFECIHTSVSSHKFNQVNIFIFIIFYMHVNVNIHESVCLWVYSYSQCMHSAA